MNTKTIYFFLFTILSLAACTPKVADKVAEQPIKNSPAQEQTSPQHFQPAKVYLVASIKTTPCYGQCPVYEAKLFSDGKAVWIGKKFTERMGTFTTKVSKEVVKDVLDNARDGGIFFLADSYPEKQSLFIPDLPNTIVSVSHGATPKVITHNHKAPNELIIFEQYLKELFENLDWPDKD